MKGIEVKDLLREVVKIRLFLVDKYQTQGVHFLLQTVSCACGKVVRSFVGAKVELLLLGE